MRRFPQEASMRGILWVVILFVLAMGGPCMAARERLLMDFGWRFHLGDPPDAADLFRLAEPDSLDKTTLESIAQEARMAPGRVNAARVNLGARVSWVQTSLDDSTWRTL